MTAEAKELSMETLAQLAGIDEGLALVWLDRLVEAGFIEPEYRLFCPVTGERLFTCRSVSELPDKVECESCGVRHDEARECGMQLVFHARTRAQPAATDQQTGDMT